MNTLVYYTSVCHAATCDIADLFTRKYQVKLTSCVNATMPSKEANLWWHGQFSDLILLTGAKMHHADAWHACTPVIGFATTPSTPWLTTGKPFCNVTHIDRECISPMYLTSLGSPPYGNKNTPLAQGRLMGRESKIRYINYKCFKNVPRDLEKNLD